MLLKGLAMAPEPRILETLCCASTSAGTRPLPSSWRTAGLAALLISSLAMGRQAGADEFDALVVYQEARPLNDEWQACAASFVRGRLQSRQTPEALAEEAFNHCRARQDALNQFFVAKIGKRAAENVMTVLRDKYQSGLIAAIAELRARE